MAKGGRAEITVDGRGPIKSLDVLMHHVERGTKKATQAAIDEIFKNSQMQVPRDTGALADSGYKAVEGKYRNFEGIIGYGIGSNPVSGEPVENYMVVVHEDLSAHHDNGKAKFLEDPVREYQARHAPNAARVIREETGM